MPFLSLKTTCQVRIRSKLELRKLNFGCLLGVMALLVSLTFAFLPSSARAQVGAGESQQYFPETGFTVSGKFLDYWKSQGGLAVFGYPISTAEGEIDPETGKIFLSQWFERERFELHPENVGTPYEILLGLLGKQVTRGRESEAAFQPISASATTPDRVYVPQTEHSLSTTFNTFWHKHGGLSILGYPISEEFAEVNPADGGTYVVQYFERARFEYHPENSSPYDIELGLLGSQLAPKTSPASLYLDNRSGPEQLIASYYNAINRKEFARAFGYWEPNSTGSPGLKDFEGFKAGFAGTLNTNYILGNPGVGAGAGQLYYTVPVVLKALTTRGEDQTFQVCFSLHLANPEIQADPPFQPLAITTFTGIQKPNESSLEDLLARACQQPGVPEAPPAPPAKVYDPTDISSSRYLDDRSSPEEVVRSLYNAINSHQYSRAYSYWENPENNSQLPPFPQFQQGYNDTRSVQLTTGPVTSDVGAGQIYYNVPVTVKALNKDNSIQTFLGCYSLHLANPGIQTNPPYSSMGIRSAKIQPIPKAADTTSQLNQICQ